MGELVKPTQKFASHVFDEAVYQVFSHFSVTSVSLAVLFITIGLLTGSMLASLAVGSFIWALLAVGCVKYCEVITDTRGGFKV